jgi:hypothetical protein
MYLLPYSTCRIIIECIISELAAIYFRRSKRKETRISLFYLQMLHYSRTQHSRSYLILKIYTFKSYEIVHKLTMENPHVIRAMLKNMLRTKMHFSKTMLKVMLN